MADTLKGAVLVISLLAFIALCVTWDSTVVKGSNAPRFCSEKGNHPNMRELWLKGWVRPPTPPPWQNDRIVVPPAKARVTALSFNPLKLSG
jgi:hypothetical protein